MILGGGGGRREISGARLTRDSNTHTVTFSIEEKRKDNGKCTSKNPSCLSGIPHAFREGRGDGGECEREEKEDTKYLTWRGLRERIINS